MRLDDTIDGLVHKSELSDQWVDDPSEIVAVGQKEQFKVISIDNTAHRLSLTLKGVKGDGKSEVKSKEKLITKYEIAKEVESEVRLQEKPEKVPEEILKKMNKTTKIVKKVNTKKQKESE